MTVYFTSDPHWGHRFVSNLRGFETVVEHDTALLDNFHDTLTEDDQTWWLGDLAMHKPDYALAQIGTIPGKHHLILGNHDRAHPMHRDSHKHQRAYFEVFESVQAFARRRINGTEVLLSHFPYVGPGDDHTPEARKVQYRFPDLGTWLLHGHTHNSEQRVHDHQIHVGLDAWDMHPVPLSFLESVIPTTPKADR